MCVFVCGGVCVFERDRERHKETEENFLKRRVHMLSAINIFSLQK